MMTPPRRCGGCGELVSGRRCPTCTRRYDLSRGTPDDRGYDTRWQRLRAQYLSGHPRCADCGQLASQVHHDVDVRDAPERRLDPSNLVSLCHSCHSKRTRARQYARGLRITAPISGIYRSRRNLSGVHYRGRRG